MDINIASLVIQLRDMVIKPPIAKVDRSDREVAKKASSS